MLPLPLGLALLLLRALEARARTRFAPEDTYSFPKYHINFLNHHPITAARADELLANAIQNGVPEFMGDYHSVYEGDWPTLDGPEDAPAPQLQKLKLGSARSFLCLTPPPVNHVPPPLEAPPPADPAKTWELLQPLTGTCLYHRQGWFTYAYCHNHRVRQFKELDHSHPHPPGGRIPQEDPDYHSYTLGVANTGLVAVQGDVEQRQGQVNTSLQLNEAADKRYLTSKWNDGTICDKTGKGREIEIQFHCSMTTTDSIQFVKETSVCQYLLVIHTPRLCGEPGFQSLREKQPAAPIHCREILPRDAPDPDARQNRLTDYRNVYEGQQPLHSRIRSSSHLPNPTLQKERQAKAAAALKGVGNASGNQLSEKATDAVAKAIEKLLDRKPDTGADAAGNNQANAAGEGQVLATVVPLDGDADGEVLLHVVDFDGDDQQLGDAMKRLFGEKFAHALEISTQQILGGEKQQKEEGEEEETAYTDEVL